MIAHWRGKQRAKANVDVTEISVAELSSRQPGRLLARRIELEVLLEALRELPLDLQIALELVYWEDLKRNRENGWALAGLHRSLVDQGRKDDAAAIEARLKKAWARADVTLAASRF